MRAFALCVVAAMMVSGAYSAACTQIAGGNLYSNAASCSAYTMCGTRMCECAGSSSSMPNTCLGQSNATCEVVTRCLREYTHCIERVPSTATGCQALNTSVRMAHMTAATQGYANSTLMKSCRNRVCTIMNATTAMCNFSANDADVCMFRPLPTMAATTMAATTMTPAMTNATTMTPAMTNATTNASMTTAAVTTAAPTNVAPADFVPAVTALLVINGNDFGLIEANNTAWAELRVALATDIAGLLQIDTTFMWIIRMWVASLHTEFAVDAAAGVAPGVLAGRLAAVGTNTSWLNSVKAAYAQVSNETLTMQPISITATAAPGVVTPVPTTPAPGSISASTGVVSAFAAVAAAAVAVLAL